MIDYAIQASSLQMPDQLSTPLSASPKWVAPWVCAELSRLVYLPFERDEAQKKALQSTLAVGGFSYIQFFDCQGTQAMALRHRATAQSVVVFRGTEPNLEDFEADVEIHMRPWQQGGRVHEGFCDALEAIWPDLQRGVGETLKKSIFTGHSLGGALAHLAVSRIRSMGAKLVTMGSPRVGDDGFAQSLSNVDCQRYVNCCDIVPRLPPENLGFVHVGKDSYIDRFGRLTNLSEDDPAAVNDQIQARAESVLKLVTWQGQLKLREVADHAIVNYVHALC